MKIWYQYGSEHSANLVMIGRFKDAAAAIAAKEVIDALSEQACDDQQVETPVDSRAARYSEAMLSLLGKLKVHSVGPHELEQFTYEVSVKVEHSMIKVSSDETDISAFLKVMIDRGARVEVYSAHDYPDSEHGRGRR